MIRYLIRALLKPTKKPENITIFRQMVRMPIIFDVISLFLQSKNFKRLQNIKETKELSQHHKTVFDYNLGVSKSKVFTTTRRAEKYYSLSVQPIGNVTNKRLLIVGPRNIQEFLIAWTYGYSWGNIDGIDLYSTHPKIKIMNMENTDIASGSYDTIVMASTLSYSLDTQSTFNEMARILKPGGNFIFGSTYDPGSPDYPGDWVTGNEIIGFIKNSGLKIYFSDSFYKVNAKNRKQASHTFCVKKPILDIELIDILDT